MNKINNKYIGVFDSGVGGLTVLKDLQENFSNESFLYMGDTKRCPYGVKEKEELEQIVLSDIKYFERKNVKMIIIACNTATANSYNITSNIPIIRIIKPTCEVANKTKGGIAILATNFTTRTKAYEKFLKRTPYEIGCSEWVDIIESGKTNTKESKESIERLLSPIKGKVQNVILGCTHFGLLEDEIKAYLGDVNVINSSKCLIEEVKKTLDEVGYANKDANTIISVTGDPNTLNIGWFSKEHIDIKKVNINE